MEILRTTTEETPTIENAVLDVTPQVKDPEPIVENDPANLVIENAVFEPATQENKNLSSFGMINALAEQGDLGFETIVELDRGKLGTALQYAKGVSPELALEVDEIAKRRNVSPDLIMRNPDPWRASKEAEDIYNSLSERKPDGNYRYPSLIQYMQNPSKAAISQKQIDALKRAEDIVTSFEWDKKSTLEQLSSIVSGGLSGMYAGAVKTPAALTKLLFAPENAIRKAVGANQIDVPDYMLNNMIVKYFEDRAMAGIPQEAMKSVVDLAKQGDYAGAAKSLGFQALYSAPNTVVTLALASVMGPVYGAQIAQRAALTYAATAQAGAKVSETKDKEPLLGAFDVATSGAAEALGERLGMFSALKRITQSVASTAGRTAAKSFSKEVAKNIMVGTGEESFGEAATEAIQRFSDWATSEDNKALEGFFPALINAGLVGAVSSVAITAPAGISSGLMQAERSRKDIARWRQLEDEAAKGNKEALADFVDKSTADKKGDPNVYIDKSEFDTFFQKDPDGYNKLKGVLGLTDEQMREAEETGEPLPINKAVWLKNYAGSELSQLVSKKVRLEKDGLNAEELKTTIEEQKSEFEELSKQLMEAKGDIEITAQEYKDMRDKLMLAKEEGGFGLTAADADASLSVLTAGLTQIARQRGETIDEAFARIKPTLEVGDEMIVEALMKKETITDKVKSLFQEKKRGSVTFAPNNTIIRLYKDANASTLMHESFHILHREMQLAVEGKYANESTRKGFEVLSKFGDMEKAASAFETYLMEGKAPSVELADAFSKFRQWLLQIYKAIKGVRGVEINDEVRAVFDRMLASETDIENANRYYKTKQDFLALLPNVSKEVKTKNENTKVDAKEKAIAKRVKQYMDTYKQAKSKDPEFRAKAEEALKDIKAYKVIDDIKARGGLVGYNLAALINTHKGILHPDGPLAPKNEGVSPEEMAAKYEYASPDEMINELAEMPTYKDAFKAKMDQAFNAAEIEIAEKVREDTFPGDDAFHNSLELERIQIEEEAIRNEIEKAENRKIFKADKKAREDAAKEKLASLPVKEAIRYKRFSQMEAKNADLAFRAASAKDYKSAYKFKKLQIFNHILVTEAVELKNEIAKIEKFYSKKELNAQFKNIENGIQRAAADLIKAFGLNKLVDPGKNIPAITDIDETLAAGIPQWLNEKRGTDYRDLTVSELRELNDFIRAVMQYGKNELLSMQAEGRRTVEEMRDESVINMQGLKDYKVGELGTFLGEAKNHVNGALFENTENQFIYDQLDGFSILKNGKKGVMSQAYYKSIELEKVSEEVKASVLKAADKNLKILGKARKRLEAKFGGSWFNLPDVRVPELLNKKGIYRFNFETLISIMLNTGNQHNLEAVTKGYGFSMDDIRNIAKVFTKEELQAFQGMWDATDVPFAQANEVHKRLYNKEMEKVLADKLDLVDANGEAVTLKGGYYPLSFDLELSHKANMLIGSKNDIDAALKEMGNRAVLRKSKPNDGFAKTRKETPNPFPPKLNLNVWFKHIDDTARFISHSEYMRDMNRLTLDDAWVKSVKDKIGSEGYKAIRSNLLFLADPKRKPLESTYEKLFETGRSMATTAVLGINFAVGVKQRLGFLAAINEIGAVNFLKGVWASDKLNILLGAEQSEAWKKIMSKSNYLKVRQENLTRDIKDAISQASGAYKTVEIAGKTFSPKDLAIWSFEWIAMNDRAIIGPLWLAAYNKSISENQNLSQEEREKNAIADADLAVSRSQASGTIFEMPKILRAEGLMRLFTSFMTGSLKYGNRMTYYYRAMINGTMTKSDFFRRAAFETFGYAYGEALIASILSGKLFLDDDDDEEFLNTMAVNALTLPVKTVTSPVPLVGPIVSSLLEGRDISATPAAEPIKRFARLGKTVKGLYEDKKDVYNLIWDTARFGEMVYGFPATNFVKAANTALESYSGEKTALGETIRGKAQ